MSAVLFNLNFSLWFEMMLMGAETERFQAIRTKQWAKRRSKNGTEESGTINPIIIIICQKFVLIGVFQIVNFELSQTYSVWHDKKWGKIWEAVLLRTEIDLKNIADEFVHTD